MSDMHTWNGGPAGDPFAPETVEAAIAHSLRPHTQRTRDTQLVRTLADAYTLPPPADAALARGRARLAQRAEALSTRGNQMTTSDILPASTRPTIPSRPITRPPRPPRPPRRRLTPFETVLRTAAAVLVVTLVGAGFYALLRSVQGPGKQPHPTPTATQPPNSATATPTTILPQPPAPAGVYITLEGTLFRIDPSTGAVEHRYPVSSSSQAYIGTPVVANGLVYVTYRTTASPSESGVVAVSATSGAQLWRTTTADLLVQLSLADGILYGGTVNNGGTSSNGPGSDTFYALRASDGSVLWTFPTSTMGGLPVVTGGVVYLANQPQNTSVQHIRALRASDGSQLWDTPLPQTCGTLLDEAVDQGMTFISCRVNIETGQGGNGMYALRASDGSVLWHSSTNGEPTALAAGAGLLYVSLYNKNAPGALDALDETSGAVRWQAANGGGLPVFDGTTAYAEIDIGCAQVCASYSSDLAAFSASSGRVLWTYSLTNQRAEGGPVIAGGVVYKVVNEQVVAISAANGSVLWRSPALSSPQMGIVGLFVVTGG